MSGRRRLAAASGILGLALLSLVPSGLPAFAQSDGGLTVTIGSPGATVSSSSVVVSGTVSGARNVVIQEVTMTVTPEAGGAPLTATSQPNTYERYDFRFAGNLSRNGRYRVTVAAKGEGRLEVGSVLGLPVGARSGEASKPFAVAAPPRAPSGLTVTANDNRSVTVSWNPNPEPDIVVYRVFRKDPGGPDFFQVGSTAGVSPASCSAKCTFNDTGILGGGKYSYRVLAFRPNPNDGSRPIASQPSSAATADLPEPPTTTGAQVPGAPAGAAPGAGAGGAPAVGSARGPAISRFLAAAPAPKPPPPPRLVDPPDTGFNRDLPFGEVPPSEDDVEPGEGEEAVVPGAPVGNDDEGVVQSSPLIPIAAGLVLIVLAAHLRHLNRRTRTAAPTRRPRPAPVVASAPVYDEEPEEEADEGQVEERAYDEGDDTLDERVAPGPRRRRTLGRRRAALQPVVAAAPLSTVTLLDPEPEEYEEDLDSAPAPAAGIHDDEWDFAVLGEDDVTIAAEARVVDAVARTESRSALDDSERDDDVVYEVVSPVR